MRLTPLDSWGNSDSREKSYGSGGIDHGIPRASLRTYFVLLLIVFAVVSALGYFSSTSSLPQRLVAQLPSEISAPPPADSFVLLARERIVKGTELKPFMFNIGHAPHGWIPQDAISDLSEINGLHAAVNIPARFPLVRDYVSGKSQGNAVSRKIPDGFRAVTIRTSTTNSVEGWARAGAHVDVQWIGPLKGELYSKLMVENAEVLSIERQPADSQTALDAAPDTVTLLTSTDDADKLGLVSGVGELVLQLRGPEDNEVANERGILKGEDLFVKREPSIDERVQGVARVKAPEGGSKTWALIDGKWGERATKK